ncbi:ATP-binding protein [Streptomyces tricolor]|nr:ATP-binding protein [Streptomyces tricolor]
MGTVSLPDTWVYALRLPHDPRAARVARMTVRAVLNGHGRQEVLDTVELLTSELVGNTYRHTPRPRLPPAHRARGTAGCGSGSGTVTRGSPAPFGEPPWDRVAVPSADAEEGRGLHLVQAYADSWGALAIGDGPVDRGAGKLLWFEVGGGRAGGEGARMA